MYWLEVSVTTDGEGAEAVSELLQAYAYQGGVVLEQAGDPDDPQPDALLPEIAVKIYVPGERDDLALRRTIEEALYQLNRLYPLPQPRFRKLADEDWATAWRKSYKPFAVGRNFWIQPSWLERDDGDHSGLVITLDPGMAFGTGLHPSTQMCLTLLEDELLLSASQSPKAVLDVGTGSGILAIAAAKLGASRVLACDTDFVAVRSASDNARQNDVFSQLVLFQGSLAAVRRQSWQLILVNILAPVIVALLHNDRMLDYLSEDGRVVLSGIIEEQAAEVVKAVNSCGGEIDRTLTSGDWVALLVKKKRHYPPG